MPVSTTSFSQTLTGTAGPDLLIGSDAGDWILGGDGNDTLRGGKGHDLLEGGAGDDLIYGTPGNNTLEGGEGNDTLDAGRHSSTLAGGAGDDLLIADLYVGADHRLSGGAGADTFRLTNTGVGTGSVTISDFDLAQDLLDLGSALAVEIGADATGAWLELATGERVILEGLTLWDAIALTGPEIGGVAQGSAGADRLFGADGDEAVNGGAGDDLLTGGRGDDILLGGEGADTLGANQGNDTLSGGAGDDVLYGHSGNNLLSGGAGDDRLYSGAQASDLQGGEGADYLELVMRAGADHRATGGAGADTFAFVQFDARKLGQVVIADFELGQDRLLIGGLEVLGAGFDGSGLSLGETEAGLVLTLDEGDTILLAGLTLEELTGWLGGPLDV